MSVNMKLNYKQLLNYCPYTTSFLFLNFFETQETNVLEP